MTKSERDFQTSLFEKEEAGKDRRLAEQLEAQKAMAGMKTDVIPDDILKGVDYVVNLHRQKYNVKASKILKIGQSGRIEVIRP